MKLANMKPMQPKRMPISLRTAINPVTLCNDNPCDVEIVLGSFWPNSPRSFESRLVKAFKACNPTCDYEPHISDLCRFYSELIFERTGERKFDWIARILSSSEKEVDSSRSQSLLVAGLCDTTGARDITHLFFRSESRPPMRMMDRLAGPDALKARIQYVAQDLFLRPCNLRGSLLLIDDICNTGASMRVYTQALKEFTGIEWIAAVNLAATRFTGGKDGRGMLKLDTSSLRDYKMLEPVWIDSDKIYHTRDDCPAAANPSSCDVRFIAERNASPCPECIKKPTPERKWWQVWLSAR